MYLSAWVQKTLTGDPQEYWSHLLDFVGASKGHSSALRGLALTLVGDTPEQGAALDGVWVMSGSPVSAKLTRLLKGKELELTIFGPNGKPARIYRYRIISKAERNIVKLRVLNKFVLEPALPLKLLVFLLTGWLVAKQALP